MIGKLWYVILSIAVAATPLPPAAQNLASGETLLQVVATGTAEAIPDRAVISTGVTTEGDNAQAALKANNVVADRITAAIRGQGLASIDIRTRDLSVGPV